MTCAALATYAAAAVLEVVGIIFTVMAYPKWKDSRDGVVEVTVRDPQERKDRLMLIGGPALIATGVIIALVGNVLALYTN